MYEILDTDEQGSVHLTDVVIDAEPCMCGETDAIYIAEDKLLLCLHCHEPLHFTD